jgi:hypothetical protein
MNVNTLRQINTTINWFIWKGEIFILTIHNAITKKGGGFDSCELQAKSKAVYYRRMMLHGHTKGTHGGVAQILGDVKKESKPSRQLCRPKHAGILARRVHGLSLHRREREGRINERI